MPSVKQSSQNKPARPLSDVKFRDGDFHKTISDAKEMADRNIRDVIHSWDIKPIVRSNIAQFSDAAPTRQARRNVDMATEMISAFYTSKAAQYSITPREAFDIVPVSAVFSANQNRQSPPLASSVFDDATGTVRDGTTGEVLFQAEDILNLDNIALPLASDLRDARRAASEYYRSNLQGTTLERDGLGIVRFSRPGLRETVSKGNIENLRFLPAIRDIIFNGTIGEEQAPRHPRRDCIVAFIPVSHTLSLDGRVYNAEVLLGKDAQGNLYYLLKTEKRPPRYPQNSAGPDGLLYQRIADSGNDVNINISEIPSLNQSAPTGVRGQYDRMNRIIEIFQTGSIDTFIHEANHFFLDAEVALAKATGRTSPPPKKAWF